MKKVLKISLIILLIMFLVFSVFTLFFIVNIMNESKNISLDKEKLLASTSQLKVFDDNLNIISISSTTGQKLVKLDELNDYTINAFISIEDKEFYNHNGLNYKRIAKAMLNNIKSMSFKEGASTISQQLIKNTHLTNEKTIKRKIKEMILTKKLEKQYDKNTILETYLNVIYFGDGCYGIEEASEHYFNKPAKDLNLSESCILASLIKSPAQYSPVNHPDKALQRRNLVLNEMKKDGYISLEEYEDGVNSDLNLNINEIEKTDEDLYFRSVVNEACEILNVTEKELAINGYIIKTYYNDQIQNALVSAIKNGEKHINANGNVGDELGIVINNENGGIQAFYGESDYSLINLKRQPGSAIKPALVYAPALENGIIHNCSKILDEKVDYNGYSPNNVGNTFSGYVSIREAVARSLNIPAVKLMDYLGIEKCKNFAKNLGIEFNKNDNGLALALGGFTEGITLQELTSSYLPYSNNGTFIKSGFIKEISNRSGVVIYRKDEVGKNVMGSDTAYLTTDLLLEGVNSGTSKKLKSLPFQIAGKTGTVAVKNTNLNTDAYSIAYTTKHTAGIWIGSYTNQPEHYLEGKNNGGTYASEHLKNVFNNIYLSETPPDFIMPETIVKAFIDAKELQNNNNIALADINCPDRYKIEEIFSVRYVPNIISDNFSKVTPTTLNVENNNSYAIISFDALDYYIYELYCNNKLLKTFEETNGQITYKHENLSENNKYIYKVITKSKFSDSYIESNTETIYTENTFDMLLNKQSQNNSTKELSWYFY